MGQALERRSIGCSRRRKSLRFIRSMAQNKLTAVGLVAAR